MNKIKLYIAMIIVSALTLIMTSCGYSEEEKAMMKVYEDNARVNAVDYIKDKYGFEAQVVDTRILKVDPGPVPDFSPSASGYVYVTMKYQDKEFAVNINGEEYTKNGTDNYQQEEITRAFKDRLEKDMSVSIEDISLEYANDCFIEKKFNDIDSFLLEEDERTPVSIAVKTLDDINGDIFKNIDSNELEILVISCEDTDGLEALNKIDYINDHAYKYNFSNIDSLDNKMFDYSIYMKGYAFKGYYKEAWLRLYGKLRTEDGVIIVYDQTAPADSVSVKVTNDMAPARDWKMGSGKVKSLPTFENPEKVSKDYAVEFGELDRLQVYLRQEKKAKTDTGQRYIALQYIDENGNEVLDHEALIKIEDYYTVTLDKENKLRISVMINKM